MALKLPLLLFLFPFHLTICYLFNGFEIRDLMGVTNTEFEAELAYWTIPALTPGVNYSMCSSKPYVGGFNILDGFNTYSERIYNNLPPHDIIYYSIKFIVRDYWDYDDYLILRFGTVQKELWDLVYSHYDFDISICGEGPNAYGSHIEFLGRIYHTGSQMAFRVVGMLAAPSDQKAYGFREIQLVFANRTVGQTQSVCGLTSISLINTLNCLCNSNEYRSSNGTCQPCSSACSSCFGPSSSECYACAGNKYFDGKNCISCDPSCQICFGAGANQCNTCVGSKFLFGNRCIDSCDPPLVSSAGPPKSCNLPCLTNEYLYPNNTCKTACPPPFVPQVVNNVSVCSLPTCGTQPCTLCSNNDQCPEYYYCNMTYQTGLCNAYMSYQLESKLLQNISNGYIINVEIIPKLNIPVGTQDNITLEVQDLVLNDHYTATIEKMSKGLFKVTIQISKPVNLDNLLTKFTYYPQGLNLTSELSLGPFNLPCFANEHLFPDNTCKSTCPSPFISQVVNNVNVCSFPICGTHPCTLCSNNDQCPEYYYCNTISNETGLCTAYISYQLESKLFQNILNGYIIRVEVTPKLNLQEGTHDNITLEVQDLTLNDDYTATIEKISKGLFKVTIQISKPLTLETLFVKFNYFPQGLNLTSELSLPKPIYISPELQKAAEVVETASVVSFFLMTVNTIGFIMSGGLATIWAFLPENQYTYYLVYLNVDYLHHTKAYFRSLANYDLLLDINLNNDNDEGTIDEGIQRSLPARFIDEKYPPDFEENAGQILITLTSIALALGLITICFKLLSLPRRSYLAHRVLKTLRRVIRWNGILRQLLVYSLPTVLASFIQLHVSLFGNNSPFLLLLLAVASLVLIGKGFFVMLSLIKNVPSDQFERLVYSEWYGTLWEDLNLNSKETRHYYLLVSFRGIILAYLAVFIDVFPYAQIVPLIIVQGVVVSLFFKKFHLQRVFETKSLNFVTLVEEILLLLMKIIILVSLIIRSYTNNDQTLIAMGWAIIVPGVMTQLIQGIYSTTMQIIKRKTLLETIKQAVRKLFVKSKRNRKVRRARVLPMNFETLDKISTGRKK